MYKCILAILSKTGEVFDVIPFCVGQIRPSVMLTDLRFQIWPARPAPPTNQDRGPSSKNHVFFITEVHADQKWQESCIMM